MNGRPSGSNTSSLQNWLRSELVDYSNRDLAFAHIETALNAYHLLKPKRESFIYDDGRSHHLLSLAGLLQISYRGASYNIPIAVWIPFDYPNEPPMAFVVPTKDMVVKAGKDLDPSGKWSGEYLKSWGRKGETCNLRTLLEAMTDVFSREPPLYRKTKEERTSQGPTPSVPSAAPARPMSGASYTGGPGDRPPMPPPRPPPPGSVDARAGSPGWASPLRSRPPPPLPPPNGTHIHPPSGRPLSVGSPPVPPHPPHQPHPYAHVARTSLRPQGTPPTPYSPRPVSGQPGSPPQVPPHPGQAPTFVQPQQGPPPPFSPGHAPVSQPFSPAQPQPQPQPTPYTGQQQPPLPAAPYPPQRTQQTPVPYSSQPTQYSVGQPIHLPPGQPGQPPQTQPNQPPQLPPQPAHVRSASWAPSSASIPQQPQPTYAPPPAIPMPPRQPSVYPSLPASVAAVQQPQPRPRIPQPDFLSSDDPDPSPRSASPPPPPLPPNPHLVQLHVTLLPLVQQRLQQHLAAASAEMDRLQKLRSELEQGPARIQDEMARLAAVRDVCLGVVARLEGVVREAEGRLADVKARGEPGVDEIVCADTIVGNQLIDLVAEDNAIEDTIYHLHRALNSGRIDLDKFIKTTRALAEEQFMKRALVEKILNGLPMGLWSA
ncbi:UEV-domain-containing protein [Dacryopinax primogenitus]|uniref:UEV-domain-containing protein n=1 Tax=Dacryopinax primogenitus (strain DJM 731) TaxID=1858805 RepID=M5GGL2_DACPD|nr:UEV-domain-containing protein [Dacryopinax primogenitus]EJU05683.1 UEV-domain-containing protein [Dacryopinax primogenitus]